jgi:hypothetical protein
MGRNIAYWASTGVIAALMCFAAFTYLSGGPQVVEGFARVGYPQQLRIILGIVKPLGAIALLIPGYLRLKEWAYAGFTYAWVCAFFAHYLSGQKSEAMFPVALLVLLVVSYMTRPANRIWRPNSIA